MTTVCEAAQQWRQDVTPSSSATNNSNISAKTLALTLILDLTPLPSPFNGHHRLTTINNAGQLWATTTAIKMAVKRQERGGDPGLWMQVGLHRSELRLSGTARPSSSLLYSCGTLNLTLTF